MAVINNYVNANLSATPKTLGAAAQVSGVPVFEAIQSFVKTHYSHSYDGFSGVIPV